MDLTQLNVELKMRFALETLGGRWESYVAQPVNIDGIVVRLTQTLAASEIDEIRVLASWWNHLKADLKAWTERHGYGWLRWTWLAGKRLRVRTQYYSVAQYLPKVPINDPATGALNPVFIRESWKDGVKR